MPQLAPPERADDVFTFLLLRSGLLREPSAGMVDFIHRTFQDYLGAKAAVEAEDLDLLAEFGRDDQWDDVIRLAVGHARDGERAYLLRRLVELGDQTTDPRLRRRYHLLAAAALEHATTLDPAVRDAVNQRASALIPPATPTDAEELATAGDIVLDFLPGPEPLTPEQARATVMTVARIGGEAALDHLARFKRVADRDVRQEVVVSWPYFDARAFTEEVLDGLPLDDLTVHLTGPEQLGCLARLGRVPHVSVRGQMLTAELVDALASVQVHSLSIDPSSAVPIMLPSLAPLSGLHRLTIESCDVIMDLTALGETPADELTLHRLPDRADLTSLARASALRTLTLSSPHGVPLPAVPLPQVTSLTVDGVLTDSPVPDLAPAFPSLTRLTLRLTCQRYQSPVDVSSLASLPHAQVDVTLVDAGKIHGLEDLPADRFAVRHDGRGTPGSRTRTGLLRRFRA